MLVMDRLENMAEMTDLALLDYYVDEGGNHADPRIFNKVRERGLARYVMNLGQDRRENKALVRAALAQAGRYVGDAEMELIASTVERIKSLQKRIAAADPTDAQELSSLAVLMQRFSADLLSFYL